MHNINCILICALSLSIALICLCQIKAPIYWQSQIEPVVKLADQMKKTSCSKLAERRQLLTSMRFLLHDKHRSASTTIHCLSDESKVNFFNSTCNRNQWTSNNKNQRTKMQLQPIKKDRLLQLNCCFGLPILN